LALLSGLTVGAMMGELCIVVVFWMERWVGIVVLLGECCNKP